MPYLTRIPLGLGGTLFRSSMPYRQERGALVDEAVASGVRTVVPLVSREECHRMTGRDVYLEYAARGWQIRAYPLEDFGIPVDPGSFYAAVAEVHADLAAGRSVLVHCAAGIGRTGMVVACLARRVLRVDAVTAVGWVRRFIPGAVETREQRDIVEGCPLANPPPAPVAPQGA